MSETFVFATADSKSEDFRDLAARMETAMRRRMRSETETESFECAHCRRAFRERRSLKAHCEAKHRKCTANETETETETETKQSNVDVVDENPKQPKRQCV